MSNKRIMADELTTIVEEFAGTFTVTDDNGSTETLDFYVRTCTELDRNDPLYEEYKAKRGDDLNEQYTFVADRLYEQYHERVSYQQVTPNPFF
jgi:hypothetical protein